MKQRIRAAGILIENGAMLLVKVRDFTGEYWIPPGGGMEPEDRSSKACLIREFKEEAGIDVEVGELICVREFLETHCQRYHAEFFYRITSYQGTPHIENLTGLNDEEFIQSVEWLPLEELADVRLYPVELKDKLPEMIRMQQYSIHLGSYVQGEREDVDHL